jgi:hypothetical protein
MIETINILRVHKEIGLITMQFGFRIMLIVFNQSEQKIKFIQLVYF